MMMMKYMKPLMEYVQMSEMNIYFLHAKSNLLALPTSNQCRDTFHRELRDTTVKTGLQNMASITGQLPYKSFRHGNHWQIVCANYECSRTEEERFIRLYNIIPR